MVTLPFTNSGNLTAMITRPVIDLKYTEISHFVDGPDADEMPTVVEYGVIAIDNMRDSTDPMMNGLIAKTHKMSGGADWSSSCFQAQ